MCESDSERSRLVGCEKVIVKEQVWLEVRK